MLSVKHASSRARRVAVNGAAGCTRCLNTYVHRSYVPKLKLIGKVLPQLTRFTPGQLFVHKKFGYYGAVLSSWTARYTEHLNGLAESSPRPEQGTELSVPRERLVDRQPIAHSARRVEVERARRFYTVIVDRRNLPPIEPRLRSDVTYLRDVADSDASSLVSAAAASKLDYVDHEDMVPVELIDSSGTQEERLVESILDEQPPLFRVDWHACSDGHAIQLTPTGHLSDWLAARPASALQCAEVHFETTAGFRVTAMPFYLGRQADDGQHVWRYWYRIECRDERALGPAGTVTMCEHNWRVAALTACAEARSSVGDQPVFRCEPPHGGDGGGGAFAAAAAAPADRLQHIYQGSGVVRLEKPDGAFWGWFRMEARDGVSFNCFMPQFTLALPSGGGSSKKKKKSN